MSLDYWLAYVLTVLVLMSTPGPSHLLMLSNSLRHGFRPALATACGDLSANVLQMLAAGLGLVTVLAASRDLFLAIKWAGVAYLAFLGLRLILGTGGGSPSASQSASPGRLYAQGFLTSAANPKAVVFFAALFPQFIDPLASLAPQLLVLGATYIAIDALFLSAYGGLARWMAARLTSVVRRWERRISGGLLILAAVLLGLKDVDMRR